MGVDLIFWSFPKEGAAETLSEEETSFDPSRDLVSDYFDGLFSYREAKEFADKHSLVATDYAFIYGRDFNSMPKEELALLDEEDLMKADSVPAVIAYPAIKKWIELERQDSPDNPHPEELNKFLEFLEKSAQHDYLVTSSWT